jgi:hypothetical protein
VCRLHCGVIWEGDNECWCGGWSFIGVWCSDREEMTGAAGVADDIGGLRAGT